MAALGDTHLVLFFTSGASLKTWDDVGILDREVALYRELRPHLGGITFVTYGGASDLRLAERLDGIDVVCNRWGLPGRAYRGLLPRTYPWLWRGPVVAKSNQVAGADVAMTAARVRGKPFVARCGYLYSDFADRQNGADSPKARSIVELERGVFTAADQVVVTTCVMRDTVTHDYGIPEERISVGPNYVETDLFRPLPDVRQEPKRICFIGRLRPQKNVNTLMDAVSGLDVELVIAGDGPQAEELQAKARALGVDTRFLGNVPHRRLPSLLNQCGLFVLPSHYEGHPKALLEAMACGLPVIGADVPGIREVIQHGENGYLAGTSATELRDAIQEVLADESLMESMGRKARQDVEANFSLPRVVERELDVLHKVVADE